MPKTLQAPLLIALIIALSLLRLVPASDPIAPLLRVIFRGSDPNVVSSEQDTRIQLLEARIEELESELEFKSDTKDKLVGANVINKTAANFRQALRIDRGSQSDLKPDQPVLADGYLIGIVDKVEPDAATVLLIGDPNVAVPVRIGDSEGIVRAYAGGVLVDQVLGEVELNEPVVTSGTGGLYPPGLIVGTVGSEVEKDIFGRYVLERPFRLFKLDIVQVRL